MTEVDEASDLFHRGYNCAQSTAAPFAKAIGLDRALVLQSMAGFGAGLGGLREICGAVSAMAYVAGIHGGASAPDDLAAKAQLYERIQAMVSEFCARHGTTCCRELLERAGCAALPRPSERTSEYYAQRPCAGIIGSAAEIIAHSLRAK